MKTPTVHRRWSSYHWTGGAFLDSFAGLPSHELDARVDGPGRPSTPLFLYDPEVVRLNYSRVSAALADTLPVPSRVLFATMCNRHPAILRLLIDQGCWFQVDSVNQASHLLALDCPRERISVTTANISYEDMRFYAQRRIFINFDSLEDVAKYIELIDHGLVEGCPDIGIRLFTDYSKVSVSDATNVPPADAESRIGVKPAQYDRLKELIDGRLRVRRVHGYSVSNELNAQLFVDHAKSLLAAIPRWMLEHLEFANFGGGFGTPKCSADAPFDWGAYADGLARVLIDFIDATGKIGLGVEVEPGRAIVHDAAVGLFRVLAVKEMQSQTVVGLNGGTSQAPIFFIHGDKGRNPLGLIAKPDDARRAVSDQQRARVSFAGNSTLQGDYLARMLPFPRVYPEQISADGTILPGDLIALANVGAYQPMLAAGFPSGNKAPEYRIRRTEGCDWTIEPFPPVFAGAIAVDSKTQGMHLAL